LSSSTTAASPSRPSAATKRLSTCLHTLLALHDTIVHPACITPLSSPTWKLITGAASQSALCVLSYVAAVDECTATFVVTAILQEVWLVGIAVVGTVPDAAQGPHKQLARSRTSHLATPSMKAASSNNKSRVLKPGLARGSFSHHEIPIHASWACMYSIAASNADQHMFRLRTAHVLLPAILYMVPSSTPQGHAQA
jgi:hypothetical protein